MQGGAYIQDDIKIRKNLTRHRRRPLRSADARPGQAELRAARRVHLGAVQERQDTLRGSWGMFYDWLPTSTYLQTLQVDGVRQREINLVNPTFPDPGDVGSSEPTNRYLLAENATWRIRSG